MCFTCVPLHQCDFFLSPDPFCILHHHPSYSLSLFDLLFSAVLITVMLHINLVCLPYNTTIYFRSCQKSIIYLSLLTTLERFQQASHITVQQYLLYLSMEMIITELYKAKPKYLIYFKVIMEFLFSVENWFQRHNFSVIHTPVSSMLLQCLALSLHSKKVLGLNGLVS